MNIEIKISFTQLTYLNDCFAEMETPISSERVSRISYNILFNLHKKLLKKTINKIGVKDKFKLSLEYYEGHFLEQYLLHKIEYVSKYELAYHSIQSVINDLNQKLA
ncbi:hypothetical protein [Flavobacterium aestivum]|uniref:hypothetical protein n=1 Tax=Flavobacterium aestivum TaxID=3003257 RepID=UPI002285D7DC|nr:hypothetical protein [Flavobacterium aestivum]